MPACWRCWALRAGHSLVIDRLHCSVGILKAAGLPLVLIFLTWHSSGTMERNVLEYVDHLHEHFVYPVSINSQGRYNVPQNAEEGYSIRVGAAQLITARSSCSSLFPE